MRYQYYNLILLFSFVWHSHAQVNMVIKDKSIVGININNTSIPFSEHPVISFELNSEYKESSMFDNRISVAWIDSAGKYFITLKNNSADTLTIKNVVPFGIHGNEAWITGMGDHPLSRTHLFIPGYNPINVIVPDDAWNLGYTSIKINDTLHAYALTKRKTWKNATRKRFETILNPEGEVTYEFHLDTFSGVWQNGLRACFQSHKLYDLEPFDETMYHRKDLQWITQAKMMQLMMAWDSRLYNRKTGKYVLNKFIRKSKLQYGGDDIIGIWPTWPTLGMDQRNQWDMYRDMPGGWKGLQSLVVKAHKEGVKIFIAYNPWDESNDMQDHLLGITGLIRSIDADGVIIDTRGASSKELQAAVDRVKPGVIMYSEGMAVPKDMEMIISGRVHNALYYPPILNLNKLIKPDFAIFRVAEVYKEPIRREIHTALFNGYGIEFNLFHPGNPEWLDEQYIYLGKSLRILREHTSNFNGYYWQPAYPSMNDSVLINYWPGNHKDIYTIYNYNPRGFNGKLFKLKNNPISSHTIDLWNHLEIDPDKHHILSVALSSFPTNDLGSNNEGSVGVVVVFDSILSINKLNKTDYSIHASEGTHILIWPANPSYFTKPIKLNNSDHHINFYSLFRKVISKVVIQVFDSTTLIDERIFSFDPDLKKELTNKGLLTYKSADQVIPIVAERSTNRKLNSNSMSRIPAGFFSWKTTHGDEFIPYPKNGHGERIHVNSFFIDRHPVTNSEYFQFLQSTTYVPLDKTNYLKHWVNGEIPGSLKNHPVIYVSQEDAEAYCRWSGKRLPTEIEWQYAAQTSDLNQWPWGNEAGIRDTNIEVVTETLTHIQYDSFDSTRANPGNSILDPIAHYASGMNAYGLNDLVGSVWQMTADLYKVGSYEYSILKGGSYYKPTTSWWYVQGGPRPLTWRQMWLKVSEGFERNATIGFRTVRN